jgi:pimeloyl-ACP methyl ester carboxylesterase
MTPVEAPGVLVDVGGYRLHAIVEGEGEPPVVLDAGTWDFGLTWALVQPEIARLARTIAYDRAGLGWSDPSPRPRTAGNMVEELRAMCTALGLNWPIVLVAQSFGALVARLYAYRYPEEVGGLSRQQGPRRSR